VSSVRSTSRRGAGAVGHEAVEGRHPAVSHGARGVGEGEEAGEDKEDDGEGHRAVRTDVHVH
jgi:hypothetical protein